MRRRSRDPGPSQDLNSPVKLLFGVYQCLHHLSFLTGNGGSGKGQPFARKVEELDRFFIPALPTLNPNFKKKCHETNEKWRQEQIGNLMEHYHWCIEALKGSISVYHLTSSELISYLNQTKKWAKQHFKKKFRNNIFDKVDQMVGNLITFSLSESTSAVKGQVPSNSAKIRDEPKQVTDPETVSTPKRKRGRPSMSETSPVQSQTPKRSKNSTYADKTKSPTIRPHASTQKDNPAVERMPAIGAEKRGSNLTKLWKIPKVTKDILVLGTSNLGRITFVARRDAQVVSYPGLKIENLTKLLNAFQFGHGSDNPGRKPSHVVLSVGINDRGLADSTNGISLRKLMLAAKKQFPDSKISIYQQPFDPRMSSDERKSLKHLNDTIQGLCSSLGLNCIPVIPKPKFSVVGGKDLIHWTENCANATVEHFFANLN